MAEKNRIPPPPWRWLDNNTLIADHGSRRVVLTARHPQWSNRGLTTGGDGGILEPLTPDHPVARLIETAPELLDAAEAMLKRLDVQCDDHSEEMDNLRTAVANARPEHVSSNSTEGE